jgi:hypothetical protein
MKWAKVSDQKDSPGGRNGYSLNEQNDRLCYKEYDSREELEKDLVHDKNVWVRHEFIYDFSYDVKHQHKELHEKNKDAYEDLIEKAERENFKSFQQRYEIFCGGFLEFYDRVVRRRNTDHTLHMKWARLGHGKEGNLYAVTIYLSPHPHRYRPHDTHANGKEKNDIYQNRQNYSTGDDAEDFSVDPPAPPPPPPPTMH